MNDLTLAPAAECHVCGGAMTHWKYYAKEVCLNEDCQVRRIAFNIMLVDKKVRQERIVKSFLVFILVMSVTLWIISNTFGCQTKYLEGSDDSNDEVFPTELLY